jgi:hypothetical protein
MVDHVKVVFDRFVNVKLGRFAAKIELCGYYKQPHLVLKLFVLSSYLMLRHNKLEYFQLSLTLVEKAGAYPNVAHYGALF